MKICVSVIVPIYNVEGYIRKCIESLVNQTLKEIEIICVDDCSTDLSMSIVAEYAKVDNRIHIIRNSKNGGAAVARNRGLQVAKGEYIYFMDSDDYIEWNTLDSLYRMACNSAADVIFFDADVINFMGDVVSERQYLRQWDYPIQDGKKMFCEFLSNQEWRSCVPMQFYSHEFLRKNHLTFYEGIIYEDELFTFFVCQYAKKCIVTKFVFYHRVVRENSVMTTSIKWINIESLLCVGSTVWQYLKIVMKGDIKRETLLKNEYVYLEKLAHKTVKIIQQVHSFWNNLGQIKCNCEWFGIILGMVKDYACFDDTEISEMRSREVVLYGTGIYAEEILYRLDELGIDVSQLEISRTQNNSTFFGFSVEGIMRSECNQNKVIILAPDISEDRYQMNEAAETAGYRRIVAPYSCKELVIQKIGVENINTDFEWVGILWKKWKCDAYFTKDEVEIMRSQGVELYGAGIYAKKILRRLNELGVEVKRVVVSKCLKQKKLFGFEIEEVQKSKSNQNGVLILGAKSLADREQMRENAENAGYHIIVIPHQDRASEIEFPK